MKLHTLLPILALTVMAAATANAQGIYTKSFSMDEVNQNASGYAFWFIPTGGVADTLNVKMSCVNKGTSPHGGHHHNHHELFVVLEGQATVNLNGVDQVLNPGDGMFCPAGSEHSIRRENLEQPIRYLLFNTQTTENLPEPLPFWKESYTADDCYTKAGKKDYWYVTPEQTLGGLNVESVVLRGRQTRFKPADGRQLVYFITEGTANVTVDGRAVQLPAMTVCYVPKNSTSTINSAGGAMRYIAVRTH